IIGNEFIHPILWMIRTFTFDPQTGYFRIETWNHALPYIIANPLFGIGFGQTGANDPFLRSIDSLYLIIAWRFGIPTVIFLLLSIFSSLSRSKSAMAAPSNPEVNALRTGFGLAIAIIAIIALTVHFWDATWILWGLCLGIRTSLKSSLEEVATGA